MLKIKGIKKTAGRTKYATPTEKVAIFFNADKMEVRGSYFSTENKAAAYALKGEVLVGIANSPWYMEDISDICAAQLGFIHIETALEEIIERHETKRF